MSDERITELIAEARASSNRNAVDDWPEHAARLIADLADALEASAQAPAVNREALIRVMVEGALRRSQSTGAALDFHRDLLETTTPPFVDDIIASGILQDAADLIEQGRKRGHEEALAAVKGAMEFRAIREGRA